MKKLLLLFALLFAGTLQTQAQQQTLLSPDGKNTVIIDGLGKQLTYSVLRNGEVILAPSPLSVVVDGKSWGKADKLHKQTRQSVDETVRFAVARKYPQTQNKYNALTLRFNGYDIEFRAYDDGVAYRFVGTTNREGAIGSEEVCYNFAGDDLSYTLLTKNLQNWFEENYTVRPLNQLPTDSLSLIPIMVQTANCNALLAEADVHNYANLYLRPTGSGFCGVHAAYPHTEELIEGGNKIYVREREEYIVKCNLKRSLPWRVMGLFDKGRECDILTSELIYLLSEKTTADYSWVKPGQVLWDWWNHRNIYDVDFEAGINTPTYLAMVDFAAEHDIPYLLIDEGWSSRESLLQLAPQVDIPAICTYAASKGVGVMLWAKWVLVDKELNEAFDQMKAWGVCGVKIDFMDRTDAKINNFYERVMVKAEQCRFLVDLHGAYPNNGLRAKYPLLMTREGVLGLEYNKWSNRATATHDVTIPYLRMWAGPMDYTPGAMLNTHPETFWISDIEPMSQGTRCHQMAMYVVYESPLQMLSDSQTKYEQNRECFDFIKQVPTVWEQTIPLFGQIGENIGVARRSGDKWYVGIMGGAQAQEVKLDLSFLPAGNYTIEAFADGVNAEQNAKDYKTLRQGVTAADVLDVHLTRGGGFTAVISPAGTK